MPAAFFGASLTLIPLILGRLQLTILLDHQKSHARQPMVILGQQTIPCTQKMPTRTLNLRNPNNRKQMPFKSTAYLLDPNLLHVRSPMSSNLPNPSNKRDHSSQVTFRSPRSGPRSSTQGHLQIHFLGSPKLQQGNYCLASPQNHNTLHLRLRRTRPLGNLITFRSRPLRSHWIFHPSYHHFQQIWIAALL